MCVYVNDCKCTPEHFISVNKLKALRAIKRLAAHVSLGVSVISWHHARQTDSCSDKKKKSSFGKWLCRHNLIASNFSSQTSHSTGCYQLMEVSSCCCQYAVTRVWRSRSHSGDVVGGLCGLITTDNWQTTTQGEQSWRPVWVKHWLRDTLLNRF